MLIGRLIEVGLNALKRFRQLTAEVDGKVRTG